MVGTRGFVIRIEISMYLYGDPPWMFAARGQCSRHGAEREALAGWLSVSVQHGRLYARRPRIRGRRFNSPGLRGYQCCAQEHKTKVGTYLEYFSCNSMCCL